MINQGTHLATTFLVKMLNPCIMSLCSLQEITPFMNALTQILLAHRQQQSGSTLANLLTDASPDTESPSQQLVFIVYSTQHSITVVSASWTHKLDHTVELLVCFIYIYIYIQLLHDCVLYIDGQSFACTVSSFYKDSLVYACCTCTVYMQHSEVKIVVIKHVAVHIYRNTQTCTTSGGKQQD